MDSRRCAEKVKKAMEVAKTAREELEAAVKTKKELLEKQLRDAELRRQQYLEVGWIFVSLSFPKLCS